MKFWDEITGTDGNRIYPKNAGKTTLPEMDDAQSDARDADSADLAFIAVRWPALPLKIRRQILALVRSPPVGGPIDFD